MQAGILGRCLGYRLWQQAQLATVSGHCRRALTRTSISAKMEQPIIIKSQNDKREYRYVCLDNGLRALLISDMDGQEQTGLSEDEEEEEEHESDNKQCKPMDGSDESDEESDMEGEEDPEDHIPDGPELSAEKKSAAALCIGVGSFSDPDDIPGFAHFLEHMVFMGSEKYPDENCFDDYISKHGGETNAWTDNERTCFYFDVERRYFHKSLDKWAQFFVSPLLQKDAVDREIEAVDSEFQERIPSDIDRLNQLMAVMVKPGNPMAKFHMGNADTLKHIPEQTGVDVYGRLRDFFNRYYTAQYMTLAIHSKHSLDTLEKWVRESFSDIHNNKEPKLSFTQFKDPFETESFKKIYKVVPVQNTHKVYLTWAFPPLQQHYRVKPIDYISTLLSHEGEGSIYSYLKKNTWALGLTGGNSGDGYDMNSQWSGFDLCITLTDDGLKNVNKVIQTVFEYISILKSQGPQEWLFNEEKAIEETRFRWKEKGDPTSYVEKLCDNMQQYPPEHFLTGHKLLFNYDAQLIKDCIRHLRADNCNIILTSSNYTKELCPLKEKWYGAQYCVEDVSPELLATWTDAKPNPELFLPKPNKFIATDFSLRDIPEDQLSPLPRLLPLDSGCNLFYKKDTTFCVPKGYFYFHVKSPVVCESVKAAVLLDLFVAILDQNMSEPTYPAILAGYEIGCTVDEFQEGIVIQVDGFNQKLKEVVDVLFDLIVNFSCSEELFQAMKTQLKKAYHNGIIKPYAASKMLRFAVIEERYWNNTDKYNLIESVTLKELSSLVHSFLQSVSVNALVIGNLTEQEAEDICSGAMSRLRSRHSQQSALIKLSENHVYELPRAKVYCQMRGFNPQDTNSCIFNYYQAGAGNMTTCCLNEVLLTRLREPCFNTLRTKKQLGYSVFSINHLTFGIIGLGICVEYQATKFSMSHVDHQIEEFLLEMADILSSMTQQDFDSLIESVVTLKKTEDTKLEDEGNRYWREIVEQTYLFNRRQHEIGVLQALTLPMLQDWFRDNYLGDRQRKLSVQIAGANGMNQLTRDSPLRDNDHTIMLLEDPEQKQSVAVRNIEEFQRTLQSLPNVKVIV